MAQMMVMMVQLMGSWDVLQCVALNTSATFLPKLVGTKPPLRL